MGVDAWFDAPMRLPSEFVRLPLQIDAARLRDEVLALPEDAWRGHPQGHPGNSALPLVSVGGDPTDDGVWGAMAPTPALAALPYLRQVLAAFGTVIGRSRLMRIDGGATATRHVDINHYWAERVRIHVPILTSPEIRFECGEHEVHMAAGEAWIFDAWTPHDVRNPTDARRIHLVADTTGSAAFWRTVARGTRYGSFPGAGAPDVPITFDPAHDGRFALERVTPAPVMTPWEQATLREDLLGTVAEDAPDEAVRTLRQALEDLGHDWRSTWSLHGDDAAGLHTYRAVLDQATQALEPLAGRVPLRNGSDAVRVARQRILLPALRAVEPDRSAPPRARRPTSRTTGARPVFDRPLIIVGSPRSGTTMVFEALSRSPEAVSLGVESHAVIEGIDGLAPAQRGWDSNRLDAVDATPARTRALIDGFRAGVRYPDGRRPADDATALRLVEKTPKNVLRIPFLAAVFPDARFLHVHREPHETLASLMDSWQSGRFTTYPALPDWPGPVWSHLLVPGWRRLAGRPLTEIVAAQWEISVTAMLDALERLPADRVLSISYDEFLGDPAAACARAWAFAELTPAPVDGPLPPSQATLTPQAPGKWRRHEAALRPQLDRLGPLAARARDREAHRATRLDDSPLSSRSTPQFAKLLDDVGGALAVSTYQAGKLIVLRRGDRGLNAHFRDLARPMGIAHDDDRLTVATAWGLQEYRDVPAVAEKLDRHVAQHDACFLPRRAHVTGDVRIHDVAHAGGETWFVATAFSCLATVDPDHSFVPRWTPPFITALTAEDRCHLNGLAVRDDRVRYVTAFSTTNVPGGWRAQRGQQGVVLDVDTGEPLLHGLSMPHSPRWHDGRLWLLESGRGTLVVADLEAGTVQTVAELPGFTRGLAFAGGYAFVGLSQVREATVFGGIPLTARLEDRRCGVWVVDLATGRTAAHLEFDDVVQELFDVAFLPGRRFPEIGELNGEVTRAAFVLPRAAPA